MKTKRKNNEDTRLLPFCVIKAATEGDILAIHKVLNHYEGKNKEEEKAIETLNVCLEESLQAEDRKMPLEILDILIEKIIIESPERIEIKCTYADLLQKWCNEMQLSDWREGGIHG